jgi:hypothetical protein
MSAKIILINLVVVSLIGLSVGQAWSSPFFRYFGSYGEFLKKFKNIFIDLMGFFK